MRDIKTIHKEINSGKRVTLSPQEKESIINEIVKIDKKAGIFNQSCGSCWHKIINKIVAIMNLKTEAPISVVSHQKMVKPLIELSMSELKEIIASKNHDFSARSKTEFINYIQTNNLYYGNE